VHCCDSHQWLPPAAPNLNPNPNLLSHGQVAGGEEHDLPLDEPFNQELLELLEAAAAAGEANEIVLGDVQSSAAKDLRPRGAGANPHAPIAIDLVRIPLMAELLPATVEAMKDRMKVRAKTKRV
jgi:hypothetical protein